MRKFNSNKTKRAGKQTKTYNKNNWQLMMKILIAHKILTFTKF